MKWMPDDRWLAQVAGSLAIHVPFSPSTFANGMEFSNANGERIDEIGYPTGIQSHGSGARREATYGRPDASGAQ
ncbi:MAG: hypothetical protein D3M94_15990 [Rhodocyclales bacterium GT-UBC]|nr:MAG: hypothetical protein D3M94_15990 [Rhodocyclales bacterium GT-UBC]